MSSEPRLLYFLYSMNFVISRILSLPCSLSKFSILSLIWHFDLWSVLCYGSKLLSPCQLSSCICIVTLGGVHHEWEALIRIACLLSTTPFLPSLLVHLRSSISSILSPHSKHKLLLLFCYISTLLRNIIFNFKYVCIICLIL